MNNYPDSIQIEGEKLKYMKEHSGLIATLLENQGHEESLELDAETMFGGDREMWKLFMDLFFPEEGYAKLFNVRNNKLYVKNSRGGEEALMDVLRYMLVNEPGREIEFAKNQARKQINAAQQIEPRGVGVRAAARVAEVRNNYDNFPANNNNWHNNNNNNNNGNNIHVGYTSNEEAMLGKLSGTAAKQYYRNNRRKATRRNRKTRRSTRKQARLTRK